MNQRTRRLQFSAKARKEIYERDGRSCLFCRIRYHPPRSYDTWDETHIFETMHIVSRAHGGLGIPQNGIIGCKYHHRMLDSGPKETRDEMQGYIEAYMKEKYKEWNREELTFKRWEA